MTIVWMIFLILLAVCLFLYYKFRSYVPILMYHRIADVPGDRNSLPPEKFEEQLNYLSSHGFTAVTLLQVYEYYHAHKPLPPKPVMLTLDDGYEDNFSVALPLLKKAGMKAVVFPITNWIGRENRWENFNKAPTQTMHWEQLLEWKAAGMEIASHTVDHPFLSRCANKELHYELSQSKAVLEAKLGYAIDFLCYPYGDFDRKTWAAVKNAGYKGAFAIFDQVPLWRIQPYALPRIPIPCKQKMWEFKLKVSTVHILFIALRKWERDFKRIFHKK